MKLKVTPEGRKNIYVAKSENMIKWLKKYKEKQIHNFIAGGILLGADWDKKSVIDEVRKASRIAILLREQWEHNMRHALAVITPSNKLYLFDIGELTLDDLEIETNNET